MPAEDAQVDGRSARILSLDVEAPRVRPHPGDVPDRRGVLVEQRFTDRDVDDRDPPRHHPSPYERAGTDDHRNLGDVDDLHDRPAADERVCGGTRYLGGGVCRILHGARDHGAGGRGRRRGSPRRTGRARLRDARDLYPGTDWNRRGRSFPGSDEVPFFAGAEENLLCLTDDLYEGEDDFVRTFALTIRRFALAPADPATDLAIDQAYGQAIAAERWVNTLAEINSDEYWMEGAQSWFDANLEDTAEEREPNSSHNEVDTRAELLDYDPTLAAIAASVYGDGTWRPACP
jgi:hypothetical protein